LADDDNDYPTFTTVYQEMMFIFLGVSYVMILQYLIGVPEQFEERPILQQERLCRSVRQSSYIASLVITDAPRAVMHTLVFFSCSYSLAGLNPGAAYVFYTLTVTMLGVISFQAAICFCSSLSDNMGKVYSFIFMVLALGSVFGGLCIPYDNIKGIFKPFYYLALPAWAFRAIMVNDLACCHLDMTCSEAYEMMTSNEMKDIRDAATLVYTKCQTEDVDGTGIFPLGQLAIIYSGVAPDARAYAHVKYLSVAVLLFFFVFLRCMAVVVLRERARRDSTMKVVDEAATEAAMSEVGPREENDADLRESFNSIVEQVHVEMQS